MNLSAHFPQWRSTNLILCLVAVVLFTICCGTALTASASDEWIELFDGKSLHGWTPRGEIDLKVVAGELHLESKANVWVVTDLELADFVLEVEAKVADGEKVNSGIAFRCRGESGKPAGYQCEIDATKRAFTGGLHAIGKGWVYPRDKDPASVRAFLNQSKGSFQRDDWNRFRIECQGKRIRIYTNGVLTTDVEDETFTEGYFGIQHHGGGGVNRFRRIRVRPIAATKASVESDERSPSSPPAPIDFKAELPRIPPTEPGDTIDTFQLQPGFKMELVAAEPLLRDPVAIDFDENGRMFVVEFPEYNQKHVRQQITDHGRVRVLDDTDGDGVYDRSQIYVDELSYPSSVICFDGGIFVAAAPEILYCKDTDGDDRADTRRVVYTGFGQEFQRAGQAQLNSFRWGLDNRIHVCTSFSGGAILRPDVPDSRPVGVRNRGFHFDPRTLQYEAASGGGQHGLGIDDWGREFRCRNSDPFRYLMYDERYLARNPYLTATAPAVNLLESGKHTRLFRISRDEPWRVLRTRMRTEGTYAGSNEGGRASGYFTSASGITVYRGDAWPAEFRGTAVVGEVSNNLIFRARFTAEGIGLTAHRADSGSEFVASTDNWFRPVQFSNGPDGALYVVDMYRELIEGASFLPAEVLEHINVTGGVNRGRIYRIVAEGTRRRALPQLGTASTDELVGLLEHRNGWHRDTAARLLYTRQDKSAVSAIRRLLQQTQLAEGRLHALYALEGLKALDDEILVLALNDKNSHVRRHALRLAEPFVNHSNAIRKRLLACVSDRDPLVRFQSAFSLGVLQGEQRERELRRLVRSDGKDKWFQLAILSSAAERRRELLVALLEDPKLRRTEHGEELLVELASQIAKSGQESEVQGLARAVRELPGEESKLATNLIRRAAIGADSPEVVKTLTQTNDQVAAVINGLLASARKRALDEQQNVSARSNAIGLLALLPIEETRPIVRQLLDVQQPAGVQAAAIRLLGRSESPDVASLLLDRWSSFSPTLRAQVVETLSSHPSWLEALLDAIERQQVGQGDIDPARVQMLNAHPSPSIRQRAANIFARSSTDSARNEVVQQYQPALELEGDAAHGREQFRRVCSSCHRLEQFGTAVGADLKAIRSRGMPAILLNILDPNREVQPQYLTYVVVTNDGRAHMGMIKNESANSITVRRSDNTDVTILRIDIDEMRSTGLSFMPEGMEKQLDLQGMADLMAYLNSIK